MEEESNLNRVSVANLILPSENTPSDDEREKANLALESRKTRIRHKSLNASSWTKEEDELIIELVKKYGRNWNLISRVYFNNERRGSQLRTRYTDVINPQRSRNAWTSDEDRGILRLQNRFGNQWSLIAKELGGFRTPNDIKNRFRDLSKAVSTENINKET
uniref:Myb-like DNA-binding domain containing protein n=1 Tax=Timspurckia oligopyrenoides TaxID=708627 RepID=A0A7S0ZIM5_9RHOD|mmetsp:Transcript_6740/g.12047  ORF Transcript_6740/g.12047 Transcript_6740/m.12047 type:complete len:161 (+) Transcript_6740:203-685(+)